MICVKEPKVAIARNASRQQRMPEQSGILVEEEPGKGACVADSATHLPDGPTLQGEKE